MSRVLVRSIGATSARLRTSPPMRTLLRSSISTLSSNPHIKVFPDTPTPGTNLLTYLDTPTPALSVGTTTAIPPTPASFSENPKFLPILNKVLEEHAQFDPGLIAQARAFAGPGAPSAARHDNRKKLAGDGGAGGASMQGGAGGAGRGGHVHLSDERNPPDFGRIAYPEDILGSLEVDGTGEVVGRLEPSGTYRILTNQGILGLSPFLRGKLVERLKAEAAKLPAA
ncbi:uncharacterized protein DNG_09260 [Cephalotrichum gorgonifer]|uniref:Uncharacterized protein n=1 Tax=Cephalotrichum gorgonifer TaxID=2041049 RepID=A0AAE8SZ41_9PEZI|nr:uncharacterized protein DNG_09260 [Cephalotrichum gorgonifer]